MKIFLTVVMLVILSGAAKAQSAPLTPLEQKVMCNKLAEKNYDKHTSLYRISTSIVYTSSWTSHFDVDTVTCFSVITEKMKGKVTNPDGSQWWLTNFDITIYDAIEDTVYATVIQSLPDKPFVDQEEIYSVGFVLNLKTKYKGSISKSPEDKEKGLAWFRLAVIKNLGFALS